MGNISNTAKINRIFLLLCTLTIDILAAATIMSLWTLIHGAIFAVFDPGEYDFLYIILVPLILVGIGMVISIITPVNALCIIGASHKRSGKANTIFNIGVSLYTFIISTVYLIYLMSLLSADGSYLRGLVWILIILNVLSICISMLSILVGIITFVKILKLKENITWYQ